ncbi:Acyl-CoA synthetase [Spironucleus salmonicida]|uniref:Acyl-CoA synthetase n=1 Tax=Spironucleus salmonicida TaxID=348837 RepID=V6LKT9_9EUKA|nr:Acyl-CoA synthetase [Spironucleus salmonicida]|eukprot:EST44983.1 Acyl-CoA synthetase [Spironucleus salmonicida]
MQFHLHSDTLDQKYDELLKNASLRTDKYLYEHEAYELFDGLGINTPCRKYFPLSQIQHIKQFVQPGKNYVLKCQIPGVLHKTEVQGVELFITTDNVDQKVKCFVSRLPLTLEGILVAEMISFSTKSPSNGEILISGLIDESFGPLVCFGFGGTTVEQLKENFTDSVLFIPASIDIKTSPGWYQRLENLPITQFLTGKIRGVPQQCEFTEILTLITKVQHLMNAYYENNIQISELEINPAVISEGKIYALDGVVKVNDHTIPQQILQLSQKIGLKPLFKTGLFFSPQSVLLVGASSKSITNPCTVVLQNLMQFNKNVKVYCIHPTAADIFGAPCFKTLQEAQQNLKQVDLFVCGIPALQAYEMLESIIDTGFSHTNFVLSAGFGETEQGKMYEQNLRWKLKQKQELYPNNKFYPLINGANTLGYTWKNQINTIFVDSKKSSAYDDNNVLIDNKIQNTCLICQSGAFMITRLSDLAEKVSPVVSMSVGNQIDISAVDFLEWILDEQSASKFEKEFEVKRPDLHDLDKQKEQIKVIGMYIEGFNPNDGQRLIRLLEICRNKGKLIYVYKSGRTSQGSQATAGHTASLSGSYDMFYQLISTSGGICTNSLQEFENSIYFAQTAVNKEYTEDVLRLGIVTNAGFEKCVYADHLFLPANSDNYLKLTQPSKVIKDEIISFFAKYKLSNVVDIDEIIDTTPMIPDEAYYEIAKSISKESNIVIISIVPETHMIASTINQKISTRNFIDEPNSIANLVVKLQNEIESNIVVTIESGRKFNDLRSFFKSNGICVFQHADECSLAVNNFAKGIKGWWQKE